jgi:hypothetical protein
MLAQSVRFGHRPDKNRVNGTLIRALSGDIGTIDGGFDIGTSAGPPVRLPKWIGSGLCVICPETDRDRVELPRSPYMAD